MDWEKLDEQHKALMGTRPTDWHAAAQEEIDMVWGVDGVSPEDREWKEKINEQKSWEAKDYSGTFTWHYGDVMTYSSISEWEIGCDSNLVSEKKSEVTVALQPGSPEWEVAAMSGPGIDPEKIDIDKILGGPKPNYLGGSSSIRVQNLTKNEPEPKVNTDVTKLKLHAYKPDLNTYSEIAVKEKKSGEQPGAFLYKGKLFVYYATHANHIDYREVPNWEDF